MKKRYIALALLLGVGGLGAFGALEYFRGHADTDALEASHTLTAAALQAEFSKRPDAHLGYKDAVLAIGGRVTGLSEAGGTLTLTLDGAVRCELPLPLPRPVAEGDSVAVKGIFGGYDDLFGEVLLIRGALADAP
jgi:hypothetical protein